MEHTNISDGATSNLLADLDKVRVKPPLKPDEESYTIRGNGG